MYQCNQNRHSDKPSSVVGGYLSRICFTTYLKRRIYYLKTL